MKLYELSTAYSQVVDLLENENDSEQIELLKSTLDSIDEAIELKADNIAKMIMEIDSNVEILSNEIERLQGRLKTLKANKDSLKNYLKQAMEISNKPKFATSHFNFSIRNNKPSVEVIDESQIPNEYIKQEIITKIDKIALYEQLKNNVEIAGVQLKQSNSLQIR